MRRKNRKNDSYKVVIIGSVAILVIIALIAVATLIKAEPMYGSNMTPTPTPVATVVAHSYDLTPEERVKARESCDSAVKQTLTGTAGFIPPLRELCRQQFSIEIPMGVNDLTIYSWPNWSEMDLEPILAKAWERFRAEHPEFRPSTTPLDPIIVH